MCELEEQDKVQSRMGKKEEEKFREMWKDKDVYIWRIPDYAFSGARSPSPCDYLVVENGRSKFFEIKHTNSLTSFPIDSFTDEQLIQLRKHKHEGKGESFVVIYNPDGMYILDIDDVLKYIRENTRKSLPFKWIKEVCKNGFY